MVIEHRSRNHSYSSSSSREFNKGIYDGSSDDVRSIVTPIMIKIAERDLPFKGVPSPPPRLRGHFTSHPQSCHGLDSRDNTASESDSIATSNQRCFKVSYPPENGHCHRATKNKGNFKSNPSDYENATSLSSRENGYNYASVKNGFFRQNSVPSSPLNGTDYVWNNTDKVNRSHSSMENGYYATFKHGNFKKNPVPSSPLNLPGHARDNTNEENYKCFGPNGKNGNFKQNTISSSPFKDNGLHCQDDKNGNFKLESSDLWDSYRDNNRCSPVPGLNELAIRDSHFCTRDLNHWGEGHDALRRSNGKYATLTPRNGTHEEGLNERSPHVYYTNGHHDRSNNQIDSKSFVIGKTKRIERRDSSLDRLFHDFDINLAAAIKVPTRSDRAESCQTEMSRAGPGRVNSNRHWRLLYEGEPLPLPEPDYFYKGNHVTSPENYRSAADLATRDNETRNQIVTPSPELSSVYDNVTKLQSADDYESLPHNGPRDEALRRLFHRRAEEYRLAVDRKSRHHGAETRLGDNVTKPQQQSTVTPFDYRSADGHESSPNNGLRDEALGCLLYPPPVEYRSAEEKSRDRSYLPGPNSENLLSADVPSRDRTASDDTMSFSSTSTWSARCLDNSKMATDGRLCLNSSANPNKPPYLDILKVANHIDSRLNGFTNKDEHTCLDISGGTANGLPSRLDVSTNVQAPIQIQTQASIPTSKTSLIDNNKLLGPVSKNEPAFWKSDPYCKSNAVTQFKPRSNSVSAGHHSIPSASYCSDELALQHEPRSNSVRTKLRSNSVNLGDTGGSISTFQKNPFPLHLSQLLNAGSRTRSPPVDEIYGKINPRDPTALPQIPVPPPLPITTPTPSPPKNRDFLQELKAKIAPRPHVAEHREDKMVPSMIGFSRAKLNSLRTLPALDLSCFAPSAGKPSKSQLLTVTALPNTDYYSSGSLLDLKEKPQETGGECARCRSHSNLAAIPVPNSCRPIEKLCKATNTTTDLAPKPHVNLVQKVDIGTGGTSIDDPDQCSRCSNCPNLEKSSSVFTSIKPTSTYRDANVGCALIAPEVVVVSKTNNATQTPEHGPEEWLDLSGGALALSGAPFVQTYQLYKVATGLGLCSSCRDLIKISAKKLAVARKSALKSPQFSPERCLRTSTPVDDGARGNVEKSPLNLDKIMVTCLINDEGGKNKDCDNGDECFDVLSCPSKASSNCSSDISSKTFDLSPKSPQSSMSKERIDEMIKSLSEKRASFRLKRRNTIVLGEKGRPASVEPKSTPEKYPFREPNNRPPEPKKFTRSLTNPRIVKETNSSRDSQEISDSKIEIAAVKGTLESKTDGSEIITKSITPPPPRNLSSLSCANAINLETNSEPALESSATLKNSENFQSITPGSNQFPKSIIPAKNYPDSDFCAKTEPTSNSFSRQILGRSSLPPYRRKVMTSYAPTPQAAVPPSREFSRESADEMAIDEGHYDVATNRIVLTSERIFTREPTIPEEETGPEGFAINPELEKGLKALNEYLTKRDSCRLTETTINNVKQLIVRRWFDLFTASTDESRDQNGANTSGLVEFHLDFCESLSWQLLAFVANCSDSMGNTALHYSISYGNFDVVSTLLDSKVCRVNAINNAGYTPAMLTALAKLEKNVYLEVVKRLYSMADLNHRATQNGQTALMLAASHDNLAICRCLLEAGGDPNVKDADGSTALMCAAEHGHIAVAKCLLSQPDIDTSLIDNEGSTAMSIALKAGHKDIGILIYAHRNLIKPRAKSQTTISDDNSSITSIANDCAHQPHASLTKATINKKPISSSFL